MFRIFFSVSEFRIWGGGRVFLGGEFLKPIAKQNVYRYVNNNVSISVLNATFAVNDHNEIEYYNVLQVCCFAPCDTACDMGYIGVNKFGPLRFLQPCAALDPVHPPPPIHPPPSLASDICACCYCAPYLLLLPLLPGCCA